MSFTSFIHKYILTGDPWSDEHVADGKLVITSYNQAYVQSLRERYAEELQSTVKTDAEVVSLHVDRSNYERESPRLDVLHGEVSAEGRVNVKLEWNDAFIKMLREAGVEGETEDDMIRVYLASVTSKVDQEISDADDVDTTDGVREPPAIQQSKLPKQPSDDDVDQILEQMDPDILKMFEKNIRRRAAKRRK